MTERPSTDDEGGHRAAGHGDRSGHGGHGRHGWMMIACCIPMIVIAITLVATGVANPGFLFVAVACTAMMAMMMFAMDHGGDASSDDADRSTHAGHGR